MEKKRFAKNDASFVCINCKRPVPPLGYSSRNHCPHCLCSLHIDVNPGDRECACKGVMTPVRVTPSGKKGFVITQKCVKCGFTRNNKSQKDDNTDLLIALSNPYHNLRFHP